MAVQDENEVVTSTAYEGEQASSPSEDTVPAEADAAAAQEPVFCPIRLNEYGERIVDETGFPIQIELEPEQNASEESESAEADAAASEAETEDSAPADQDGDAATPSAADESEQASSPSEDTEPTEADAAASETVDAASGPDPYDYVVDDPLAAGVMTKEFLQSRQFFDDFAPKSEGIYVGEQSLSDIVGDMVSALTSANKTHPRYSFDDTGIAYLFADSYKWKLRYVSEMKQWYIYHKGRWTPCGNMIMEYCKHFTQRVKQYVERQLKHLLPISDRDKARLQSTVNRWQSRSARQIILQDAASVYPVSMKDFDKNPLIFNCENGTLNVKEEKFIFTPHNPKHMLTKMANVKYDPKATCPLWDDHMEKVLLGDKELREYLQKALGYALTGVTNYECFFILYGKTTRNGKGVTMNTFLHMLGDYGRNTSPETFTQKKYANSSGPSEDVARLAGARFVNVSEPDKNMVLSSALIKTLTGGDIVTARFLHGNSFEFKPQFKIFINTNYLPKVDDQTIFDSKRVWVIPFKKHFEDREQDTSLKGKMTEPENLSGILNWCLEGLRYLVKGEFSRDCFDPPAAVKEATEEYKQSSSGGDDFAQFIADVLEAKLGGEVSTTEVYNEYVSWCRQKDRTACVPRTFKQGMERHHVEITKKRPSGRSSVNPISMIIDYQFKIRD